jgi:probable HAF family extracellular repeat protein
MSVRTPRPCITAATSASAMLALLGAAQAAPMYHVVDLGEALRPDAINAKGEVAGSTGANIPSVYRDGAWQELKLPRFGEGYTAAINAGGSVAGYTQFNGFAQAVVWKPSGKRVTIPQVDVSPDADMWANDITDDGLVVGSVAPALFESYAFRWKQGSPPEAIGVPPGGSWADAVSANKRGQIVGQAVFPGTAKPGHAFLYDGGTWEDLGTLGGKNSHAKAINGLGHVAGCADTDGAGLDHQHAFLYTGQAMIDLGAPEGMHACAYGIASDDTVAGIAMDARKNSRAFIYKDGVLYDKLSQITDAGKAYHYSSVNAVAADGQMVVEAYPANSGIMHVLVLQPVAGR